MGVRADREVSRQAKYNVSKPKERYVKILEWDRQWKWKCQLASGSIQCNASTDCRLTKGKMVKSDKTREPSFKDFAGVELTGPRSKRAMYAQSSLIEGYE